MRFLPNDFETEFRRKRQPADQTVIAIRQCCGRTQHDAARRPGRHECRFDANQFRDPFAHAILKFDQRHEALSRRVPCRLDFRRHDRTTQRGDRARRVDDRLHSECSINIRR